MLFKQKCCSLPTPHTEFSLNKNNAFHNRFLVNCYRKVACNILLCEKNTCLRLLGKKDYNRHCLMYSVHCIETTVKKKSACVRVLQMTHFNNFLYKDNIVKHILRRTNESIQFGSEMNLLNLICDCSGGFLSY